MTPPPLVLVGHGSRDEAGAAAFRAFTARVAGRLAADGIAVAGGFIELSEPPLREAVATLAGQGHRHLVAVPVVLSAASHAKGDIPASLARERARHPGLNWSYGRALGPHPVLLDLLAERIAAAVPLLRPAATRAAATVPLLRPAATRAAATTRAAGTTPATAEAGGVAEAECAGESARADVVGVITGADVVYGTAKADVVGRAAETDVAGEDARAGRVAEADVVGGAAGADIGGFAGVGGAGVLGEAGGVPEAARHAGPGDLPGILLAARGTTDPDANAEVCKSARLLWEGRDYAFAETAFVSLAEPGIAAGLERCRRLGARQIIVARYFLFPGVLPDRVDEQAREYAAAHPELDVRGTDVLGDGDELAGLVIERYREALAGDIRMNCDTCAYRIALPGSAHLVGAAQRPHAHPGEDGRPGEHGLPGDHGHPPHAHHGAGHQHAH